jgi:hypothetical protein
LEKNLKEFAEYFKDYSSKYSQKITYKDHEEYEEKNKEFKKLLIDDSEQKDPKLFDVNLIKILFDIFIE